MRNTKQLFALALLAVLLLAIAPNSIHAQDQESSATLEETLAFLHDFIGSNGHFNTTATFSNTVDFTTVEKCTVKITHQQEGRGDEHLGNNKVTEVSTFSLSDIDPFELDFRRVETFQRKDGTDYASS